MGSLSKDEPSPPFPAPRDEPPAIRPEFLDEEAEEAAPGARVFLIRHADASDGPKDPEHGRHLTPLGRRQAEALARRMSRWSVDAIVCSDKHRTQETAVAVQRFHPDASLTVDATFREASRGTLSAYERGDPEGAGLPERLESAWNAIVSTPHPVTVFVVHNGLIKYLLGRTIRCEGVFKPRFHCTETGITGLRITPKGPLLEFFNDTHHLTPDLFLPGAKVPWFEPVTIGH